MVANNNFERLCAIVARDYSAMPRDYAPITGSGPLATRFARPNHGLTTYKVATAKEEDADKK